MININFYVSDNEYDLTIKGHANYSNNGNDIVCAGVSAIALTLWGFLERHKGDGIESIGAQPASGDMRITCKGGKTAELAFDMAMTGLQYIAIKYPKHVSITIHPR